MSKASEPGACRLMRYTTVSSVQAGRLVVTQSERPCHAPSSCCVDPWLAVGLASAADVASASAQAIIVYFMRRRCRCSLAAFRSPEHHPGREAWREGDEAMFDTGRNEEAIARLELMRDTV